MSYLALFYGYFRIVDQATTFYGVLCASDNTNDQLVSIDPFSSKLISFSRSVNYLHLLLRLRSKHQRV